MIKRILLALFLGLTSLNLFGQGLVNIGDKLPNYLFTKVINSSASEISTADLKDKPTIFALWGTWCSPCIPEMISLGKLQKIFGDQVQIIGVSNDSEEKLKTFVQKRPSKIWFATDPSQNFWNIFNINTAGYAILVDKNKKIVGITQTHAIDSLAIAKLINSTSLSLKENRGTKRLQEGEEPIKLDSNTVYSFVIKPELKGISPMMKRPNRGAFAKRRITVVNLVPEVILREAFEVSITKKVFFASKKDSILANQQPFCVDLIVPEEEKINLKETFLNEVNRHLPVKGQIEKRLIACYNLKPIAGAVVGIKESAKSDNEFSYYGLKFEGSGIRMASFIRYLENELGFPVYDSTNLTNYYDLIFEKDNIDPLQSIKNSLAKLGLELIKEKKEMDVLVVSAR